MKLRDKKIEASVRPGVIGGGESFGKEESGLLEDPCKGLLV